MSELLIAGVLFLGTHLGVSNSPLRGALMRGLSERGYQGLYSLVALATMVYFVMAYNDAPRLAYLWSLDPRLYWAPKLLMLPAFMLLAGGLMGGATQTAAALKGCAEDQAKLTKLTGGMNRITRHPVQWAIALWALSHIVANGDAASVVFFAAFLLLSLIGSVFADRKKAAFGVDWQVFAAATSHLPFAAIASGRNKMAWGELGVPAAVGLVLYIATFWGHEWLSGASIYW